MLLALTNAQRLPLPAPPARSASNLLLRRSEEWSRPTFSDDQLIFVTALEERRHTSYETRTAQVARRTCGCRQRINRGCKDQPLRGPNRGPLEFASATAQPIPPCFNWFKLRPLIHPAEYYPISLHPPHLLDRFQALDQFLLDHQALWRPRPFTTLTLAWETDHPVLATWLRARTLAQAELEHNQPERVEAPAPFRQLADRATQLSRVDDLPHVPLAAVPARSSAGVPGRKWQQIEAFATCLDFSRTPQHWLDWCAGKGHLGRRLAQDDSQLTCLELDPSLVEAGQQLSQRLQLSARHVRQDVLAADAHHQLRAEHTPVALHACGQLHVRLLQLASAAGCRELAVAPCCYNRIDTAHYQALSRIAQASTLRLSRTDLGLPLSETVTAGARVRRQRDCSMARRLAFDLLQRNLRDSEDYLPTPSLPAAWLDKSFADYCSDLAAQHGLSVPAGQDWPALEAAGWQRLAEVRNLELLRGLFRRPLELWLLLDRALYLQEQGYQVRLGRFCDEHLSPRNLLLLAERH